MKKLLAILLALSLLITAVAGCKKEVESTPSDTAVVATEKPTEYAAVVVVTINPQFKLYLDEKGTVLAVEGINEDAKEVEKELDFTNAKLESVVADLVTATKKSGFLKEDHTVKFEITEWKAPEVEATEILKQATEATNEVVKELEVAVTVETEITKEVQQIIDAATVTSSEPVSSKEEVSSKAETAATVTSAKPVCEHKNTRMVSAKTGKNVIDKTKLDGLYHEEVCADCGEKIGKKMHTVKAGKCTACAMANLPTATFYPINASSSGGGNESLSVAKINNDGSVHFDIMMEKGWYSEDLIEYATDYGHLFTVPEKLVLRNLRTKFTVTDSQFTALKKQAKYNFWFGTQTYADGYFKIVDPAAGGPGDYSHNMIGYKDNGKGTLKVYYDYVTGGPDVDEHTHEFYYVVTYSYSGTGEIKFDKDEYGSTVLSGWKPVIDSLRVTSIKKTTDISGITKVK